MFKTVTSLAKEVVAEMQELSLLDNIGVIGFIVFFVGLAFTKTKYKIVDIFYFAGFLLMSLFANRSVFFLYFIGAFIIADLLSAFFTEYNINIENCEKAILNKPKLLAIFSILLVTVISKNIINNIPKNYFSTYDYPIRTTQYILDNVDLSNMRIYNSSNYGGYLEFYGIQAFSDTRFEIYCEEFNNTTILEDSIAIEEGTQNYKKVFEKYGITHVLIYKNSLIDIYISQDEDYELLYEEDRFTLYAKKVKEN